ncbi:hypothetical protein DL93DRAFT_941440 [Clavulina sp. PMI_390]|nr:hypothetical protein DL93DRAFT_1142751 [Clavulina sp. PMI_390]KAF8314906.1 hypothetical protein DL93DRAFT_941440 [Clavulina sp. PMI_390]
MMMAGRDEKAEAGGDGSDAHETHKFEVGKYWDECVKNACMKAIAKAKGRGEGVVEDEKMNRRRNPRAVVGATERVGVVNDVGGEYRA